MPANRPEHEAAYRQITERGHTQWNDLFDPPGTWTYDHFQNRAFLERVLAEIDLPGAPKPTAFEYGCGTGPAACFLAARGFAVDAVDLIPDAIAIARRMAEERDLEVRFGVADICTLADVPEPRRYDLVVDSFCLQSIVTDDDRRALFAAVRARMKPNGRYVIATALRDPGRVYGPDEIDDPRTGIVWHAAPPDAHPGEVTEIDGRCYLPHRRHLTPKALRAELVREGFEVLSLDDIGFGAVVCRLATSGDRLREPTSLPPRP